MGGEYRRREGQNQLSEDYLFRGPKVAILVGNADKVSSCRDPREVNPLAYPLTPDRCALLRKGEAAAFQTPNLKVPDSAVRRLPLKVYRTFGDSRKKVQLCLCLREGKYAT